MLWERSRIVMDDGGGGDFTFAAAQRPPRLLSAGGSGDGGRFMGPPLLYPVFGRARSPPRAAYDAPEPETATERVPLERLLLVDKDPSPPLPLGQLLQVDKDPSLPPPPADDVDDDLDSVPAELYCRWSPGWSAAAAASSASTPARCKKSGSTGSVLRWRPRLDVGRSQSDGKEKFVFLSAAASSGGSFGRRSQKGRGAVEGAAGAASAGGGGDHAWSCYVNKGGGARRRRTFLPYKQDLVGLFANAAVFRRSYLPF